MTVARDGYTEDPLEKLKQLQDWLVSNQVQRPKTASTKAVISNGSDAAPAAGTAEAEVADFQSWVTSIQSPMC